MHKRPPWYDLSRCVETKRMASAILRDPTVSPFVPATTIKLPKMIPPNRVIESSSLSLAETNAGLQKRIDSAFEAEQKRTLATPELSWQNRLPGEEVLLPMQLMWERALNTEARDALASVSDPTTARDKQRSLDVFDFVETSELEMISKEWEESFMRAPRENESECSRGEECWGVTFVENNLIQTPIDAVGFVLVRFQTPKRETRPDGLCVVCLRAYVSALFHSHVESGKPQSRVIQPYRVSTTEYDSRVCLSRNSHTRFMGITDPFPQFFVNSFEWCEDRYKQKDDLNFNRVATKALRHVFEVPWLRACGSRRFSATKQFGISEPENTVRKEATERFYSVENKMPIFGIYSMSSFWCVRNDLISYCLRRDSKRAAERFVETTKRARRPTSTRQKQKTSQFVEHLSRCRADPTMWIQFKQMFRLSCARYQPVLDDFDCAVFRLVHSPAFFDWCESHEQIMIAVVREYASHVLEYQGFLVSNSAFWKRFSADVRRRMDEIVSVARKAWNQSKSFLIPDDFVLPNYEFPTYKPWYWSFESFPSIFDEKQTIAIDCRHLLDDENEFIRILSTMVSPATVQYFLDRRVDAVRDPEIDRVKNTLKFAFSMMSIRLPAHWSHTGRSIYLLCPACRQWRSHVTPTIRIAEAMKRRRKNAKPKKRKSVPIKKTMGAQKTAYDVHLDRFVCLSKRSNCDFSACVPIRFAGKWIEYMGDSYVRCPACERIVAIDPDNPSHAENDFDCGCVPPPDPVPTKCHSCDAELNKKQMKPVLVFGTVTEQWCFCKEHAPPSWTENKRAWHNLHLEACLNRD